MRTFGVISISLACMQTTGAFVVNKYSVNNCQAQQQQQQQQRYLQLSSSNQEDYDTSSTIISRRQWINKVAIVSLVTAGVLNNGIQPAYADVSDGTSLPQGAQQFARVIRLKSDLNVSFPSLFIRDISLSFVSDPP